MSETKDELLKSFHQQFAENQNHHQTLFIQFISAVFIVIVGYAIVYTNTSSDAGIFNVTRDKDQHILSYAIIHLIGSFFMAELTLTLLCILLLNIGYSYRRDQNVIDKIRKYYMKEEELTNIFNISTEEQDKEKPYVAKNKSWLTYLPDFNLIFVIFIIVLQLLLIISVLYAFNNFNNPEFKHCCCLLCILCLLMLLLPLGISILAYCKYYKKYKKAVNVTQIKTIGQV